MYLELNYCYWFNCSEQTRIVLTSAAYVHLKQADLSKHIRNLSPASRAILLSGPAGKYIRFFLVLFRKYTFCTYHCNIAEMLEVHPWNLLNSSIPHESQRVFYIILQITRNLSEATTFTFALKCLNCLLFYSFWLYIHKLVWRVNYGISVKYRRGWCMRCLHILEGIQGISQLNGALVGMCCNLKIVSCSYNRVMAFNKSTSFYSLNSINLLHCSICLQSFTSRCSQRLCLITLGPSYFCLMSRTFHLRWVLKISLFSFSKATVL